MSAMSIQITILCENSAGPSSSTIGEHGFAAFIETESGNYLFDTGQGFSILHNATCLKKDLSSIKAVFLSHGHYDHTGGLPEVIKLKNQATVYAHPDIFTQKYALVKTNGNDTQKYIGMRHPKEHYELQGARFVCTPFFAEAEKGIFVTGEIPRTTAFEEEDPRLVVSSGGKLLPDPLRDDQSLVLKTGHGLVIVLGCAHAGLINTIEHVLYHFKKEKLYAVIGGTHLGFLKDNQIDATVDHLKDYGLGVIGASHCTGFKAAAKLFQTFKERFVFAIVGTSFTVH